MDLGNVTSIGELVSYVPSCVTTKGRWIFTHEGPRKRLTRVTLLRKSPLPPLCTRCKTPYWGRGMQNTMWEERNTAADDLLCWLEGETTSEQV